VAGIGRIGQTCVERAASRMTLFCRTELVVASGFRVQRHAEWPCTRNCSGSRGGSGPGSLGIIGNACQGGSFLDIGQGGSANAGGVHPVRDSRRWSEDRSCSVSVVFGKYRKFPTKRA